MVLDIAISLVLAFVLVVVGSYLGSKMALNTFFGRDFDPFESEQFTTTRSASDENNR